MNKYEFTGEAKVIQTEFGEKTLHRIRASVGFKNVHAGDLGGWIEKKENLSNDGNAWVYSNAQVYGGARVRDNARVYSYAEVYGNAQVRGNAEVRDNAKIFDQSHVLTIGGIGSRNDFTTFYLGKENQIMVKCGCFNGTIHEFYEMVTKTHGQNKYAKVYRAAAKTAELQINQNS